MCSGSGARVPQPPGMRRTSSGGAEVRVAVGRMDWERALGREGGRVDMGVRVVERRIRDMGGVGIGDGEVEEVEGGVLVDQERTLRTSRGPKTSRAWKPGKRRTPMRRGGGDVVVGESGVVVLMSVSMDGGDSWDVEGSGGGRGSTCHSGVIV